jgi:DNA-binding NarL/FixJ family response regulator
MRILIASAKAAFRQEMRALLENAEEILTFEQQTGPQIIDQIRDLQPDLILLDLDAETSQPLDLVSAISRQHPDVRIVVLAGPGQDGQVLDALRNGAHGHLVRGASDRQQILAALQAVGRGDSILSPALAGVILDEVNRRYRRYGRPRVAATPQQEMR